MSTLQRAKSILPLDKDTPYECPECNKFTRPGWVHYASRNSALSSLHKHLQRHRGRRFSRYVRQKVHKRSNGRLHCEAEEGLYERANNVVPVERDTPYECPVCTSSYKKPGWCWYTSRRSATCSLYRHLQYHKWAIPRCRIQQKPKALRQNKQKSRKRKHQKLREISHIPIAVSDDSDSNKSTLNGKVARLRARIIVPIMPSTPFTCTQCHAYLGPLGWRQYGSDRERAIEATYQHLKSDCCSPQLESLGSESESSELEAESHSKSESETDTETESETENSQKQIEPDRSPTNYSQSVPEGAIPRRQISKSARVHIGRSAAKKHKQHPATDCELPAAPQPPPKAKTSTATSVHHKAVLTSHESRREWSLKHGTPLLYYFEDLSE